MLAKLFLLHIILVLCKFAEPSCKIGQFNTTTSRLILNLFIHLFIYSRLRPLVMAKTGHVQSVAILAAPADHRAAPAFPVRQFLGQSVRNHGHLAHRQSDAAQLAGHCDRTAGQSTGRWRTSIAGSDEDPVVQRVDRPASRRVSRTAGRPLPQRPQLQRRGAIRIEPGAGFGRFGVVAAGARHLSANGESHSPIF